MAEGTLFDIAARIMGSLESLARKEIGLFWGATADELEKLKKTVSTIQAVLLDAEVQGAVKHEVKDWLEKLKDVFYDADDLLDGFSTDYLLREMKMAKKVRIFFSKSNQTVYNLKMGHKIKAIRQKLDAIVGDLMKFHFVRRPMEIGVRARKRDDTHSYVLAAKVTDRDGDKENIITRLLSDSNIIFNVGILPIIGIGGLGKTTLAQFIFIDEEIDKHFQLKLWVCVSESFDVKKVVEKILELTTRKMPESVEMDTLVHNLRKQIGGKKYLLVLDDVWNEEVEKWNQLKKVLEIGASGSRILITTRSRKVAHITQTIGEYSLQCLGEGESWSLFKQVAFENGQEPVNYRIVKVGKEIVEKCSGVPLVIKTIGRLLSLEDSEARWLSFQNNKLPKIKENDIIPTLKLSYDQLPSHLKECFAYCTGFIKPSNPNECLEDVGHEYFMDLIWRLFFKEVEMDDLGNVITIKMHELMHELAMSVAGSWHVSVADNIDFPIVIPTSSSKSRRIRTLFSYGKFGRDLRKSQTYEAIFSSLKSLRVLDLHGKGLHIVPSSICRLKHLRYLDLSWNYQIEKLPDSITWLQNLHTLRLSYCYGLKELPRGITKLVNLRHLYNDGCKNLTNMPRGLGQLTNLQTLSKFVVHFDSTPKDSGRLSELNRLDSLRLGELKISDLRHGEDVALNCKDANLKKKEHLQVLRLCWSTKNVDARDEKALEGLEPHPNLQKLYIDYYGDVKVPMWLLSLANLIHLSLGNCTKLKYLPPLNRLCSLKSLYLNCLDEIEYVSDYSDNNLIEFFPSLEVIRLQWCPNLKGWWRTSDPSPPLYFPRLSNLTIRECPMLTSLPMFPHLQEDLYLWSASWKPVQLTMMENVNLSTTVEASSSSSIPIVFSSAPLSKLKEIRLMHIGDIETLPEDGLQNLISLKFLEISDCPRLKSLSQGIQYLTALNELKLIDCPVLDLGNDEHGMQWKGLKSLISLEFQSIPKLVSLPLGLQHVTTLRQFQILSCSSFIAIPEWISNWASLEVFTINACSGLTSLPKAMEGLSSLKMLTIYDCPFLVKRCEKETGEDWHKIAHIRKRNVYRYGNMI
ncbi:hypothetical protein I3842_14G045200 [Carya illinoinensis]|uniref:Disease resistance protein RGA3 n=1 Tax=Carya illinoinensis TaxID=32201 RepID=A0A922D3P9_CARIL|nr:hypothetical protein I3842_14G045200 [Carya illinoinensis]